MPDGGTFPIVIDRAEIATFVNALFPPAGDGWVQLRAFYYDANQSFFPWPSVNLKAEGIESIINKAADKAQRCASEARPVVFAPPICTFTSANGGSEADVALGLVLSVECDKWPNDARWALEELLGEATLVVKSGGEWIHPETDVTEDKLHLHWRLSQPTRTAEEHERLKQLRKLACRFIEADTTGAPVSHPYRWAGSVHRKGAPRLARINSVTEAEIELDKAFALLRQYVPDAEAILAERVANEDLVANSIEDVVAALAAIPNGPYDDAETSWNNWTNIGLATFMASNGSDEGFASYDKWSAIAEVYDEKETKLKWEGFKKHPPNAIGMGTLAHLAREADPGFVLPSHADSKPAATMAARIAYQMQRNGKTFEEYIEELRVNPETADWYEKKGKARNHRQTNTMWNKADPEVTGHRKRPVVKTYGGGLPAYVDKAESILVKDDDELFQRGDFIVRPAEETIPTCDQRQTRGWRLVTVGVPTLVERMTAVADFQRLDSRSGKWVSINCPTEVATTYLARVGKWKLRPIAGIINCPTLRPDGSILDKPGYDAATKLLCVPSISFPPVPLQPTREDAVAALAVLKDDLLSGFPFVGSDGEDATGKPSPSRSVALSCILTTIIRRSVPNAPMHAVTAPVMGSGKSKIIDIASLITMGHECHVLSQGETKEEMDKRLAAALLAGDTMISFDNCEKPLGSELLNQALTQLVVKPRILGKSENSAVPANAMFCATGNNLILVGDMVRRVIEARIDPRTERPELREFNTDPVELIHNDRAKYVIAALTVLRAYVVAGKPNNTKPLGSFEDWSRLVRNALIWLDQPDPCDTMEKTRGEDPEAQLHGEVMRNWRETFEDEDSYTIKDVIAKATDKEKINDDGGAQGDDRPTLKFVHPGFRDALLAVAGDGGMINSLRLSKYLGKRKGRIINGLRIETGPMASGGVTRWKVVEVTNDDAGWEF